MLSPPKPLDEIQPNLVCELLPWMGCATAKEFWPGPLGRGQKVKYHLISTTKLISNFFIPNFCVCSHKWKIQNISDRIFILSPGTCPMVGTWGCLEAKIKLCPAVCPLCYLLLNHWTKVNQIWCVSYSHEWGMQQQFFFGPSPLGRGQKVKYHLISITKLILKISIPNFVCVLTNERYKTYQTGFLFCRLGHALGLVCELLPWMGPAAAVCNSQKNFDRAPWGPGERSKSQISFNFNYKVNFKKIYTKLCVCSHKWKIQNISDRILFYHLGHALGVGLGGA